MKNEKRTQQNNLLETRRRSGLEAKQVSFLLGKTSPEQLYRYESGFHQPNTETLFKLAIIYRTPPHFLYQKFYKQLQAEIAKKVSESPRLASRYPIFSSPEQLSFSESCYYKSILESRVPSDFELSEINKHVLLMMNVIAEYKQGRTPFDLQKSDK